MHAALTRIEKLLREKGWKPAELSRRLQMNINTYSDWKRGRSSPDRHLRRIAEILETTEAYLRDETEDPRRPGDAASGWLNRNSFTIPERFFSIPILGNVSAGPGIMAYEDVEGYERVDAGDISGTPEDYFYLRVYGNSMAPTLYPNDLVLVKKQNAVDSGQLAVVLIDGEEGVIKRVEYHHPASHSGRSGSYRVRLVSDNEDYEDRIFSGEEINRVYIVGVVMQAVRKFT